MQFSSNSCINREHLLTNGIEMSQQLTEFLTALATDKELVEAFNKDKEKTMREHGVPEEHIELVVNKKYDEVQSVLGANYSIVSNGVITAFKN